MILLGEWFGFTASRCTAMHVARWLRGTKNTPVVLDPVMHGTRAARGAPLLASSALPALVGLVRLATIVTPNVPEAELLDRYRRHLGMVPDTHG